MDDYCLLRSDTGQGQLLVSLTTVLRAMYVRKLIA